MTPTDEDQRALDDDQLARFRARVTALEKAVLAAVAGVNHVERRVDDLAARLERLGW